MKCIICEEVEVDFRVDPACSECKEFIKEMDKASEERAA